MPPAGREQADSFGTQLTLFGLETTWSGYGDITFTAVPGEKEANFEALRFNPILGFHLSESLSGEMEIEFEHSGLETVLEYAMLDFTPFKGSRALVLRCGKFLTPIGKFNEQFHPTFRWAQASRPLMFDDVVPVTWSEVGIQARGFIDRGGQAFEYAIGVVNGLAEPHPPAGGDESEPEPAQGRDVTEEHPGFVRGLRNNFFDNNLDKAVVGRAALTIGRGAPVTATFGLSGYTGKLDDASHERLSIADADVSVKRGPLSFDGEVAQVFVGRWGHYLDRLSRGAYVQAVYTFGASGRWTAAGRWDYARQGPRGGPLTTYQSAVATVRYAPAITWSVRLELGVPFRPSGSTDETAAVAMLSFAF